MSNPKEIPFNKPHAGQKELDYIRDVITSEKISGDGKYTRLCTNFFEDRYRIGKALLTTSCTDALEMAAILSGIGPGDEVVVPSFTFVSTANAFALRGAKIVFADSGLENPNVTPESVARALTDRTRIVVLVHYAGVACDIDAIRDVLRDDIIIVEDAAQAIESNYKGKSLGTIGSFGTFSFHETKNIICGEGGLIAVNDENFFQRAEIIREKGTNRSAFFRGDIDKYGWVDIGSSFLPSDILAAYLYGQLESISEIQQRRLEVWQHYWQRLYPYMLNEQVNLPHIPSWASNNAHMFYVLTDSVGTRDRIIKKAREERIGIVFHYQALHASEYGRQYGCEDLPNSIRYSECLIRLPLFFKISNDDIDRVCDLIISCLSKS